MQTNLKNKHNFAIRVIPSWFKKYEKSIKRLSFFASFKKGINYYVDDRLLFIGLDETPFSLTLTHDVSFDWSVINEECFAYIKGSSIYIESHDVSIVCDCSNAKICDYQSSNRIYSDTKIGNLHDSIARIETLNGFGLSPKDFVSSIQSDSFELRSVVGKGLGLTPSGDDFIVGVLFAQTLVKGNQEILAKTLSFDPLSTTKVSSEYLKYACESKFSKRLLDLSTFKDNELDNYVNRIKNVGHTSGLDTLSGMFYVLDKEVGHEKNSSSIRW